MPKLLLALFLTAVFSNSLAQPVNASEKEAARLLFEEAFDSLQKEYFAVSRKSFEEGLDKDPNNALGWRYYGDLLLALSKRTSAKIAYRNAARLASAPKDKKYLTAKADAIKISIAPGPACKWLVEMLDLEMIKGLAQNLMDKDIPAIRPSSQVLEEERGTLNSELCGDIYIQYTYTPGYAAPPVLAGGQRMISLVGYPQLGFIVVQNSLWNEWLTSFSGQVEPLTTKGQVIKLLKTLTRDSGSPAHQGWYGMVCVGLMLPENPDAGAAYQIDCEADYDDPNNRSARSQWFASTENGGTLTTLPKYKYKGQQPPAQ